MVIKAFEGEIADFVHLQAEMLDIPHVLQGGECESQSVFRWPCLAEGRNRTSNAQHWSTRISQSFLPESGFLDSWVCQFEQQRLPRMPLHHVLCALAAANINVPDKIKKEGLKNIWMQEVA